MTTPSNFLKELQAVYVCEDYRGDITNPPLYINGVKAPTRSKTSYEGLPGNQPGQGNWRRDYCPQNRKRSVMDWHERYFRYCWRRGFAFRS